MAGVTVEASYRGQAATAVTDAQGYYDIAMQVGNPAGEGLWETAEVRLAGPDSKPFKQPVLCVPEKAEFGLISDIDDTVLQGNGSRWQAAFQTTLLSNARTRKPLEGVGQLYQSFQQGHDGAGQNPVFYVSAGPWNMYELLVDFMEINGLPPGPILLRDVDFSRASLLNHAGPLSKLAKIHGIIDRYPALKFVLVGDSAQIDADLYTQTVEKYPGRILAVYIRDIDPTSDSTRDQFVDSHIERVAGSKVPMLRVANSNAIAEHARTLGLIAPEEIKAVAKDVAKDKAAPAAKT
jgi:phosphatidate phosphatase APP1